MVRRNVITVALLLTFIITYGYYHHLQNAHKNADKAAMAMRVEVSVMRIVPQDISMTVTLPGRISAFMQAQVRPQVSGIITDRMFEEGSIVKLGQQLYQLDDLRYKAALATAKAELVTAQSKISAIQARTRRYEQLLKNNAVSRQDYDDVKSQLDAVNAGVEVAKANVNVAEVNLAYTKIYAPIAGKIGRTLVTEGALATADQTQSLAVITQLDPVYVDLQQSSTQAVTLNRVWLKGQDAIPVTLMLGEKDGSVYPHKGTLKFSEVTIDESTDSVTLRAIVPNPEGVLMPGMFARADLELGAKQAMLVPQRATLRDSNGNLTVWVVNDKNQVQPRIITAHDAYNNNWIVTNGLQSGEVIVVEGYQKLHPGAEVISVPWIQIQVNKSSTAIHDELKV